MVFRIDSPFETEPINTMLLEYYDDFEGDSVAMYHWMRAHNKHLEGTPHFLIVDDGKLQNIYDYLLQANLNKSSSR